jgi:hypothetical protein
VENVQIILLQEHCGGRVRSMNLEATSGDVEVGDPALPPMPTCLPTSPIVLVRNLCALVEALSRDAKPIWTKQYLALRSNLLVLSAKNAPSRLVSSHHGSDWAKDVGPTNRKARKLEDTKAAKKAQSLRAYPNLCKRVSAVWTRPGIEQAQLILIVGLWMASFFFRI